jgi:hypothetical protein
MTIAVSVQLHTWWNDSRSHASIKADLLYNHTADEALTWKMPTIRGSHYVAGWNVIQPQTGGKQYQVELETWTHHHLYQIFGVFNMASDDKTNAGCVATLWDAIGTMVVTGVPDSMPTPAYHPFRAAPKP